MKYLNYNPCTGTHIECACNEALTLAQSRNRPVRFAFNGVTLKVNKHLSRRHILRQWDEMMAARKRRHRESKAGREAARKRAAEIAQKQDTITAAIRSLPGLVEGNNLDHLIGWLKSFAYHADDVAIDFNAAAGLRGGGLEWICLLFESKGYRENDGVGQSPSWFNTRGRLGRYIIGQAIGCMRHGMPPYPCTEQFCNQYFAIQGETSDREESGVEDVPPRPMFGSEDSCAVGAGSRW